MFLDCPGSLIHIARKHFNNSSNNKWGPAMCQALLESIYMYYFIWSPKLSYTVGVVTIAHFTDEKCILISDEATVSRAHALTLPYAAYLLLSDFCLPRMVNLFWGDTTCPGHLVMIGSLVLSCRETLHMYQGFPAHPFLLFLYLYTSLSFHVPHCFLSFHLWPISLTRLSALLARVMFLILFVSSTVCAHL